MRAPLALAASLVVLVFWFGGAVSAKEASLEGPWDFFLDRGEDRSPRICLGTLEFHRTPSGWNAVLRFQRYLGRDLLRVRDLEVLRDGFNGRVSTRKTSFFLKGTLDDDVLSGVAEFEGDVWGDWSACRPGLLLEPGERSHGRRLRGRPGPLDEDALRRLVVEARDARTDALLLVRRKRIVVDRSFGFSRGPVALGDLTRFVTGLGIARLLTEGEIPSLETPLATWYPEWQEGPRAKITLRHVLAGTTGLARGLGPGKDSDELAYALGRLSEKEPGEIRDPDPALLPLLAGIFPRTVGRSMDEHLEDVLHRPLRLAGWTWAKDAVGLTRAGEGLAMTSGDLARLARLVLEDGKAGRKQLIDPRWIRELAAPGLLWTSMRSEEGEPEELLLRGRRGQALLVARTAEVLAVRLRRSRSPEEAASDDGRFDRFPDLVRAALR